MDSYAVYLLAVIFQSYTKIDTVSFKNETHAIVQTYKSSNNLCASEFSISSSDPVTEMYILPDEDPAQDSIFQGDISTEDPAKFVGNDLYWRQSAIMGRYSYPAITILDKSRSFTLRITQYRSRGEKGIVSSVRITCDVNPCTCKEILP